MCHSSLPGLKAIAKDAPSKAHLPLLCWVLRERRDRRARRRLRERRPKHLRPRRAKVFGAGRVTSLDRNAKARIECRMRVLTKRTEAHKHYGR